MPVYLQCYLCITKRQEMKVKETIAFIGEADDICSQLIEELAGKNYPLVLVAKDDNHFDDLAEKIRKQIPEADIETIPCEREGCWEADIIFFNHFQPFDAGLPEKIKEVANQKILVYFLTVEEQQPADAAFRRFQKLLPNTDWVQVVLDGAARSIRMESKHMAVLSVIENIFITAGYRSVNKETRA